MKTTRIATIILSIIAAASFAGTCLAQDPETSRELEVLRRRVAELERIVAAEQKQIIRKNPQSGASALDVAAPPTFSVPEGAADAFEADAARILDRLNFTGAIEIEAGYARTESDAGDEEGSDITLATFELGVEAEITDWIKGTAVLLWEEDDTEPVDLDTATIFLGNPEQFPFSLEIGKFYVPFGSYDSAFITDPMTLELGETRESAGRVGFSHGPLQIGLSIFNGDVNKTGSSTDHLGDFVLDTSLEWEWENSSLALGAAYSSNLADSDGLQDAVADNAKGGTLDDLVAGLSCWVSCRYRRASLSVEYLAALDDFEPNSLSFDGPGNDWMWKARPRALNFELAYIATERLILAAKVEHADDTFDWLPKRRYGGCAHYLLHEGDVGTAILGLEYLHGNYDDADNTREDTVTVQLALEF